MAEIRCPMCSRANAEELETCQFCGARLRPLISSVPSDSQSIKPGEEPVEKPTSEFERTFPSAQEEGPIHAGEEPIKKNTGELEQALPTWLRALRQSREPAEEQAAESTPDEGLSLAPQAESSSLHEEGLPDWLAGLEAEKKEEKEDIPDWLAGLQAHKQEEKEETPDWLDSIRSAAPVVRDGTTPKDTPFQGSGTDWLSRLGGEPAEAIPSTAEPGALPPESLTGPVPTPEESAAPGTAGREEGSVLNEAEGLPAWLAGLESAPAAAEEAPAKPQPSEVSAPAAEQAALAEELPDWLADLKRKAVAPEETSPLAGEAIPPAPAAAGELPDWLSRLQGEGGVPAEAPAPPAFTGEPEAVIPTSGEPEPDWLSKLQAEGGMQEEATEKEFQPATEPLPAEPVAPEAVPEWMAGVEKGTDTTGGPPAMIMEGDESVGGEAKTAFSVEIPDWLTALKPEEGAAPALKAEEVAGTPAEITPAELPSWVQAMRPVESVVGETEAVEAEETPPETQGPLAGLRGVLPVGEGVVPTRKPPAHSIKLQVGENQQRHAAQLEKMVAGENEHRPVAVSSLMQPARLLRWIVAAVLILAVALPIMTGMQVAPALTPYTQYSLIGLIDSIPANSPVLIAFDYEPAFFSELEAAAEPLISRLVDKDALLTLVSTSPTGILLAENFLQTAEAQYNYQAGQQYVNLGYLAGGPAGVRSFAETPRSFGGTEAWQGPPLQAIQNLSDYAAVIILTDSPDTGRIWIEQAGQYLGGKPMIMVISAQAEPLIQPYYDAGQIQGLVTGLAGGKALEQALSSQGAGLGLKYWSGFSTGLFAAVIIIFIGGVWSVFSAWRARQAGRKGQA